MEVNLITGLKEGNLAVYNSVYSLYNEQIHSFIRFKTQSDFIASEVVQLTFIKLWEKREILKDDIGINVQLFGMARQVMIDELRKEAVRHKYSLASAMDSLYTDSLTSLIETKDLMKHFKLEMEHLPPIRKIVFQLSRENGLSHKEIAEMLAISPKTVESHIYKVLLRLKQYMYTIFFF
ncbi:RNA polymerase sigma-70 factor (ECF subfamily) [Pedobacter sp. CAN_A7]|uniref:RNA polymerase sigma factor n=1 Tax=Pedobacter sp. CAN_A7 TaxID=2787722 RepID=UPI0018C9988B